MQATIKLFSQHAGLPLTRGTLSAKSCLAEPTTCAVRPFADRLSRHSGANGNREYHLHQSSPPPIIFETLKRMGPARQRDFSHWAVLIRHFSHYADQQCQHSAKCRRAASSIIALAEPMNPSQRQLRTSTPLHETAELHSHTYAQIPSDLPQRCLSASLCSQCSVSRTGQRNPSS